MAHVSNKRYLEGLFTSPCLLELILPSTGRLWNSLGKIYDEQVAVGTRECDDKHRGGSQASLPMRVNQNIKGTQKRRVFVFVFSSKLSLQLVSPLSPGRVCFCRQDVCVISWLDRCSLCVGVFHGFT